MAYIEEHSQRGHLTVGLTPLIDVVFILLIFFMLVVQFTNYQQVPLSTVEATDKSMAQRSDTLVLKVMGDNTCSMEGMTGPCLDMIGALDEGRNEGIVISYLAIASLGEILTAQAQLTSRGYDVTLALKNVEDEP